MGKSASFRIFPVLLLALAYALLPASGLSAEGASKRPNLVRGGFEGSLSGWRGHDARVRLTQGGAFGRRAARVRPLGRTSSFSIYPARKPVGTTVAGARYSASASVRSLKRGRVICLRIREWDAGSVAGSAQTCMRSAQRWKRFSTVAYRAAGDGRELDVYVYQLRARRRDRFDVDGIVLRGLVQVPPLNKETGPPPTQTDSAKPPTSPTPPPLAPPPENVSLAPTGDAALVAAGLDNSHIRLEWLSVPGAASYRVFRGTLLIGVTGAASFTDTLLWPATRYSYRVDAIAADGSAITSRTVASETRPLPATGFPRPFSPTSFWNRPIGSSPRYSPRDAGMSRYMAQNARNPNITLHAWGVSVAEVRPSDPTFNVPCTRYTCTLSAFGAFQIPLTAQPDPSNDGHLAVYDPATQREWGMWQAKRGDGSWSASAGAAVSMTGDGVAPSRTQSGNAANFPMLGGIIRPEEILQGHIDHALVFMMPGVGEGRPVCPATHNAGSATDPDALREGQKVQLDPSVNVDALNIPAWQKTIARAMQQYGMYLRDGSGSMAVLAENPLSRGYDAWASLGLGGLASASLAGIPWDRFHVIDAPDC